MQITIKLLLNLPDITLEYPLILVSQQFTKNSFSTNSIESVESIESTEFNSENLE